MKAILLLAIRTDPRHPGFREG